METINNIHLIGVISDTHIPSRAKSLPNAVYELFKNVNLIVHCGDFVNNDVLIELNTIAPVLGVKGNMDPNDIDLPVYREILLNNATRIIISHGSGPHFNLRERLYKKFHEKKPDIIIYGHSHIPDNSDYNGIHMFNPGSACQGHEYNSTGFLKIENSKVTGEIIKI